MNRPKTAIAADAQLAPLALANLLPPLAPGVAGSAAEKYEALRQDFAQVLAGMAQERGALAEQLANAQRMLQDCIERRAGAEAMLAATRSRIEVLAADIDQRASEGQRLVDAAQAAFDDTMASEDGSAQQKAAEQLHEAQSKQQVGTIMQGGLRVRLTRHHEERIAQEQALEATEAAVGEASEEVRLANLNLALLDSDEASTRALAAYLRVRQTMDAMVRAPFLQAVEAVSFWFSAPDRAVRWNNWLANDGKRHGPVHVSEHHLRTLVGEVRVPVTISSLARE